MGMHAHVAWLRQQGMLESVMDAPVRKSGSTRLASHRLAKTAASPPPAKEAAPKSVAATPPKPSAPTRTAPVASKPQVQVPAHVEAKGPIYAAAYREGFSRFGSQVERLKGRPEAQGRIGSLMMLATEEISDSEIIAKLGNALTDRQRAADAVWDRAYARIAEERGVTTTAAKILIAQTRISPPSAKAQQILANQRAFGGGKRSDADAEADSVWGRAWANHSKGASR